MVPADPSQRELDWLRKVRDFSQRLAAEQDLEALLPLILEAAIEISGAERGFLVRVLPPAASGEPRFHVEVTRGFDRASLQSPEAQVSRTVVERVLAREREGLVSSSEEDRDVTGVTSVRARQVLSIACVPMRVRGETLGVLYLDHRLVPDAFAPGDLPILRTFADQAALALETADLLAAGKEAAPPAAEGGLVGASEAALALREEVARAARSWEPVLVLGERGAGKLRVARAVHERSARAGEPFLVLDGEALAAEAAGDVEGELFGTGRGAGLLTLAGKGTLFLREVAELPLAAQARLLRLLRTRGELRCRLIAGSRHDLRQRVEVGAFMEALYYQLDVLRIIVPPLRQRPEDVPLLVEHLSRAAGKRLRPSPNALALLQAYAWPGNVRELENEVRRLVALGEARISGRHLSPEIQEGRGVTRAAVDFAGKTLGEVERELIRVALDDCQGNKARAARQLGIPRSTLYHLLERYGLG